MLWLIAKREFRVRTLSKANIVSASIMIGLVVVGAIVAKPFLSGAEPEPETIAVDNASATELVPYLEAAAHARSFHVVFEAVAAPAPGDLPDDVLAFIAGPAQAPQVTLEEEDPAIVELVTTAAQAAVLDAQVIDLGGDPSRVQGALAQATPQVTILGEPESFDAGSFFAGLAVVMVLFVVLIQSSSVIMMGVVEEKASRVVEILLATVRPSVLLGGKVLGVGMYALVQAAQMVVPLLFAAWYLGFLDMVTVGMAPLLVNFGVWFVLGFALFTILFGGLAALVSRQEDIGSVTTPMIFLMMVPLYLGIYLVPSSPDGTATQILTQIPFFAPFMVPMRAAFGGITMGETLLAAALCLIAIPLLTWFAGRVYAGAVLNTGGRMKIADALKSK